jgi:hypothetical protein
MAMSVQKPDGGDLRPGDVGDPRDLLPQQIFSGLFEAAEVEGERRLVIAVLEDAVHCFQRYALASDAQGQDRFREAEEWLMEPDTGAMISFEYICEIYGFDAESIRARLRRWREARIAALRRKSGVTVLDGRDTGLGKGRSVGLKRASGE